MAMTNTERIQANNAELREAIEMAETLPEAGSGGEDVTEETNDYTEKLEALETAITALENELEGKASGGASIEAWTGTVRFTGGLGSYGPTFYYTDETLTTRTLENGNVDETITIAAGTAIYMSIDFYTVLENAEVITGENDIDNGNCKVIRPTANGFSISN